MDEPPPPPGNRTRSNVARVIVALAVISAAAWFIKSRTTSRPDRMAAGSSAPSPNLAAAANGPERVVPVDVATATREDLPIWLEGLGTVGAFQQVTVRAQVDGRLDTVAFIEGQPVKKGDLLAQIDPRPFAVQLHTAEGALARDRATLATNQATYDRDKSLHDQNLIAQQQVDEAKGALGQTQGSIQIDQAAIENARLQLDYASVRSPIDGVTGVRLIDAGNLIHASDATGLVVVTQVEPAAVVFTVPQDKLPPIAAAMARGKVVVEVYNRDNTQLLDTGTLAVLDNQINPATATLRLKAIVPNQGRTLWPNAFVKARMLIETRVGALVVPAVAVQRGPQGAFVYVVDKDGLAQMTPVTVALQTGDRAVIGKGLEGGERVVTEGTNQLRPGGKVSIAPPKKKP